MSKIISLEALIASPPTSKCQETIGILEEVVRRHPDELRLVVYKRGVDLYPDEASQGMKLMMQKGAPIPTVVVGGNIFCANKMPKPDELEATVQEILLRAAEK
jgi:hypothetical protein